MNAHAGALAPIERAPAHRRVVERIRRAIHLGEFLPGDRLPSEPAFARELGVSRSTLRAAIRELAAEGYLTSKRGAAGGLFVTARKPAREARLDRLRDEIDRIWQLLEYRRAVECAAAGLAAERRGTAHLARLESAVAAIDASRDVAQFRRADSAFHLAIADAAGNRYLRAAIEEVRAGMFELIDLADFDVMVSNSATEHARILRAIAQARARAAEAAMARHIETARGEIRAVVGPG